jgi:hypothetical protein
MRSKQVDGLPDLRVGLVENRVRKIDWLWQQILEKQREIRLLENEIGRTDSNEYMEDVEELVSATTSGSKP